jgi:hypothetical protein
MTRNNEIRLHHAMTRLAPGERLLVSQKQYRQMRHLPRFKYRMHLTFGYSTKHRSAYIPSSKEVIWVDEFSRIFDDAKVGRKSDDEKLLPQDLAIYGRCLTHGSKRIPPVQWESFYADLPNIPAGIIEETAIVGPTNSDIVGPATTEPPKPQQFRRSLQPSPQYLLTDG